MQDAYYKYYDRFYHIVKDRRRQLLHGVQIYGTGRTVKLQKDFSAMMGPDQFSRYIVPALDGQARQADHVLYHWTAGRHQARARADGMTASTPCSGPAATMAPTADGHRHLYDQAVKAGKGLWVKVYTGAVDEWMDRWIAGCPLGNALFLYFSPMSRENADRLLNHAENWRDAQGASTIS